MRAPAQTEGALLPELLQVPVLAVACDRRNERPFFYLMGKRKCKILVLCSVPWCLFLRKDE